MTYAYKVRDRQGKLVTGTLEAESVAVVSARLRSMGYVPVSIEDSGAGKSLTSREIKIPGLSGRIKLKEVAVFSRQFATMINSGLTLLRALSILAEQTENKELARIVGEVRKDVERGSALSAALAKHPKAFSRLYVAMVRSGETGGSLDSVLLRLATTIEKQVELRRKVKSAMTYPIVVGVIVVLILIAMLIFVVPMFKGMYGELNAKLPVPTMVLLTVSNIFKKFFLLVFAGAGAGAWAAKRYIGTPDGRRRWDAFKLRAPVFGQLAHKSALARFSRSLAALVRSGVPILDALEIVSETAGNTIVSEAATQTQAAVKAGESLARPLEAHPVFPPMVVQMIAVGEETGALDEMLEKIADFYDGEVEATVDALTSLIEPLLIVVMGVAVGGMVVALYMPMFSIISKLDGGGAGG
ncbi:MAG TPA: type II secretion system F family protein [Acidimicrobiia bacterium]|nr:type II secretion system F family protein [Acidimicrobiia bacterium]